MAEYVLKINDRPVRLSGSAPDASLQRISIQYAAPRELRFRWYGPAIMSAAAELIVDGVTRFYGTVQERKIPADFGHRCDYTAFGLEDLAGEIPLQDTLGNLPRYHVINEAMVDALRRLLSASLSAELQAHGVTPEFVGATGDLLPEINLRGGTFSDAMKAICGSVAGFTWLIDPDSRKLLIINMLTAPTYTVEVGAEVVSSHEWDVRESVRRRYTAVKIFGKPSPQAVASSVVLAPAWDSALESTWSIDRARLAADPAASASAYIDVFRKFEIPAGVAAAIDTEHAVELYQQVPAADESVGYQPVEIGVIDVRNELIWTKEPVIDVVRSDRNNAPNLRIPGKGRAPLGVILVYRSLLTTPPPGVRMPAVGYAGSAHDVYGIDRELVLYDPTNENVTGDRARRLHAAYADVMYEGQVPLAGEMPTAIWNLGRRINITMRKRSTGLENAQAILEGVEYDFQRRRALLALGGDKSPFVGEGIA